MTGVQIPKKIGQDFDFRIIFAQILILMVFKWLIENFLPNVTCSYFLLVIIGYLVVPSNYSCLHKLYEWLWLCTLLNFEDSIQKVNETIYLPHFYISDHLTQIRKVLFIYHIQFLQKALVSTMSWCNSICSRVFYLCLYLYITMLRITQYVL